MKSDEETPRSGDPGCGGGHYVKVLGKTHYVGTGFLRIRIAERQTLYRLRGDVV